MTTQIIPSAGQGALFTQQGPGQTPGYSALDDRRSNSGALQEGVLGSGSAVTAGGVSNVVNADFMVTQRNAGANMSVDVNMPPNGFALVQGDTINGQGLYGVPVHSSNINEVVATADASNPRIDQLILEVLDNVLDASGNNLARTRVLTGAPTAGATLNNRSGALALPGSACLLADWLVPAGVASIPNANIRDRRKWARGAYVRTAITAGDVAITGTTYAVGGSLASTQSRLECSGLPLRITAEGRMDVASASAAFLAPFIDGVVPSGKADVAGSAASSTAGGAFAWTVLPAAGSHTVALAARVSAGSATLYADATESLTFIVEELLRQNSGNNGVTSG